MMTDWQLQDAKGEFDEIVNRALSSGPQRIIRRHEVVIVMSESEYKQLTGQELTFKEFLPASPDFSDLDLARDLSPMREVDL
jgi:prevent-host-death family protein